MKKQKVIIFIIAIVLVVLGGGYYLLSTNEVTPKPVIAEPQKTEDTILTISPEELGLTLTAGVDKKRVIMEITNLKDLSSLDYELSYTSKGNIPRGAIGNIEVKSKDKLVKKEIVLGTCSDVCHYDLEVSDIKLILKVTKTDGKVYESQKTLEL